MQEGFDVRTATKLKIGMMISINKLLKPYMTAMSLWSDVNEYDDGYMNECDYCYMEFFGIHAMSMFHT